MNQVLPVRTESEDEIVARATALIPSLRERAARIAENRSLPHDVFKDLEDAGLLELMRPARFGGPEYSPELVARVGRELGKGDGATSWVYMVTQAHDGYMPLFPEAVQAEYWASENCVGASSYMPTGRATPAEGGYRLSGRWSFCSGIDHSGWLLLGGIVGMTEHGPDWRFFLLPTDKATIIDDWYLMGLRGTGSKSVEVNDVFVADDWIITMGQLCEGSGYGPDLANHPDYKESAWTAIGFSLVAPATGIVMAAFDQVVADIQARLKRGDPTFSARKQLLMAHLGEVSALIETSDLIYEKAVSLTYARMAEYKRLTPLERATVRRNSCYSVKLALEAAQLLLTVAGASGLREAHPAQRAVRDLHAIAAHPAVNWDSPAISYGSVMLDGVLTELMV